MEELYFNIELKKCLNTAAFSDDLWDWWYQRLHQAHDASVDRVTDIQRVENAKLRKFATETWELLTCNEPVFVWKGLQELARNLGIEVDE